MGHRLDGLCMPRKVAPLVPILVEAGADIEEPQANRTPLILA
jgi:hypothetical protein